jgi:hypothetical protein
MNWFSGPCPRRAGDNLPVKFLTHSESLEQPWEDDAILPLAILSVVNRAFILAVPAPQEVKEVAT